MGVASLEGDHLVVFYYPSTSESDGGLAFGGNGLLRGGLLYYSSLIFTVIIKLQYLMILHKPLSPHYSVMYALGYDIGTVKSNSLTLNQ